MKIRNVAGYAINVDGKRMESGAELEVDDSFKKSGEFKKLIYHSYIEEVK